ncbi:hypothetical protein HRW18_36165 [Streptomyces lunaelactis]|uniref:hypothetical protein n=1 Tax=Streptomyces lunaelactis TaxID=1535768 RepID=UPI001585B340|nr:hypothetical protein [Streptomyces lunaelactis]NUK13289.1 hypothetical protein [Streptomyces lunaelactis]NUL15126.1 hypothetical protein [Streptomyces lunaelactis]NUL21689.1 hypothetical protein [Streptomyces lunaelactis]
MTQPTRTADRICPNCDGFPSVAVTLGGRDRSGHLRTITAHCPACHGTGTAPLWLVTTRRPVVGRLGVTSSGREAGR